MNDEFDAVLAAVGPRLRELRRRRGSTLTALAESTGIPISTLSRLESGQRRPALDLLLPLAKAFQVPLDDLVGAPASGDPRVFPRPVTRFGLTVIPLTRKPGGLQAFKMVLPAGPADREPDPKSHEGYHWLYVLNGRLRLVLGDQSLVLSSGEVAEFDTHLPHWFGTADTHPVELLSILGPQGERFHLRASSRRHGQEEEDKGRERRARADGVEAFPAGDQGAPVRRRGLRVPGEDGTVDRDGPAEGRHGPHQQGGESGVPEK
ncbi:XRE family transcriptional regulator [Actinoplanes friuliensis DSM 7358]|uniref:XRE family transcriptional regulator n=1 Tax=Actinoplanes friuliensis DSM 7358 TaxID=1246995 RepID=U5W1E4_9ACTN|nr:XRE family transcriptional regulator [Actinoplanes friuliensis DSM 7358]